MVRVVSNNMLFAKSPWKHRDKGTRPWRVVNYLIKQWPVTLKCTVEGHVLISSLAWPGLGWSDYVKIHNILIGDITLGTRPGQANFALECQSGPRDLFQSVKNVCF